MLKLERKQGASGGYAEPADFCRVFKNEMKSLYLLAFLLTANHVKAEWCFLAAFADAGKETSVFEESASPWSRRAIIAHATRLTAPVSSHASKTSDLWDDTKGDSVASDVIDRLVQLSPLERFGYVLSVLEHYSDAECAALIGCTRAQVMPARLGALERLASVMLRPMLVEERRPLHHQNERAASAPSAAA